MGIALEVVDIMMGVVDELYDVLVDDREADLHIMRSTWFYEVLWQFWGSANLPASSRTSTFSKYPIISARPSKIQ